MLIIFYQQQQLSWLSHVCSLVSPINLSLFLLKWQVHSDYHPVPHLLSLYGVKAGLGYSHNPACTLPNLQIQQLNTGLALSVASYFEEMLLLLKSVKACAHPWLCPCIWSANYYTWQLFIVDCCSLALLLSYFIFFSVVALVVLVLLLAMLVSQNTVKEKLWFQSIIGSLKSLF